MTWQLTESVTYVGSQDPDRRLFDELIPLPDGTSYNSYLIRGDKKTALIDAVDPTKQKELLARLKELKVEELDYVIANHAEQDHSGAIAGLLKRYPEAKVVTNEKCAEFLKDLLDVPDDRFRHVKDGESLPLGGKTLEFIIAPWVHWPETMLTYLREDKILFTCDLFGSHLATDKKYAREDPRTLDSAKRYFAEIMMPFRAMIRGHMDKLKDYEIGVVAPSHGPVYDEPEPILEAYRDWVGDDVKNEVVVAYVSMHGSVAKMADHLVQSLTERGITVKQFNLTGVDIGEIAMALVDAATVVVASPTVLVGAHPAAANAAFLVNALRPKTRLVGIVGSYGWGGTMVDQLKGMLGSLNAEVLTPVMAKGHPGQGDLEALESLAEEILKRHRDYNIT